MKTFKGRGLPHFNSADVVEAEGQLVGVPLDAEGSLRVCHLRVVEDGLNLGFDVSEGSFPVFVDGIDSEADVKRSLQSLVELLPLVLT